MKQHNSPTKYHFRQLSRHHAGNKFIWETTWLQFLTYTYAKILTTIISLSGLHNFCKKKTLSIQTASFCLNACLVQCPNITQSMNVYLKQDKCNARPPFMLRSSHTSSYEVPPSGTLFHIRNGPLHLWTYSNCCQVCSVQVEHSEFICLERSKQN